MPDIAPQDRKLGRVQSPPDPRDRNFAVARAYVPAGVNVRTWRSLGVLDQGPTSECVIYSGDKFLTTAPIYNKGFTDRTAVYKEVQKLDDIPGEDYEGTTVRGLFRWLRANGYCREYRWAFDYETVVNQVLAVGPVVMGTNWYNDMFTPDDKDYLWPSGGIAGGHAWTVIGVSRLRKNPDHSVGAVRMINSWGTEWGDNGRAWVTFNVLDRLIKEDGEACVAVEVKS